MFGISSFEFLLILLVALMVLGPDKLPKIMRTLSKVMFEFRRVKTDFQRVMNTELAFQEQMEQAGQQKKLEHGLQVKQQAKQQAAQEAAPDTAPDAGQVLSNSEQQQQAALIPDACTGGIAQPPAPENAQVFAPASTSAPDAGQQPAFSPLPDAAQPQSNGGGA